MDRARVGEANLALGKLDDARRAFKVAAKLDPTNASYAASLASLETAGNGGENAGDPAQTRSPNRSPKTHPEGPSPTRHRPPPPRPEPPRTTPPSPSPLVAACDALRAALNQALDAFAASVESFEKKNGQTTRQNGRSRPRSSPVSSRFASRRRRFVSGFES